MNRPTAMMAKLKFILPVLLLVLVGGLYKFVLAKPAAPPPEPKVEGEVYVLAKQFLVNLAERRYAMVTVALELEHEEGEKEEEPEGEEAAEPPEGYGSLPQEALVRAAVTQTLTGADADELTSRKGRERLRKRIARRIERTTDVKAHEVFFPDLTVQ